MRSNTLEPADHFFGTTWRSDCCSCGRQRCLLLAWWRHRISPTAGSCASVVVVRGHSCPPSKPFPITDPATGTVYNYDLSAATAATAGARGARRGAFCASHGLGSATDRRRGKPQQLDHGEAPRRTGEHETKRRSSSKAVCQHLRRRLFARHRERAVRPDARVPSGQRRGV